jgi:HTH-type transcriptional regulator/antitoxin HigA
MPDLKTFTPSWVSPPGDTIADILDERGWTNASFAERLDVTPKHVSELVQGKASISADMAGRLSLVLGSTLEFWLTREAQYRAALERRSAAAALEAQASWLRELPLAWMVKQGWLERPGSKSEQVAACLSWFGVASVDAWRSVFAVPLAAWRASKRVKKEPGAVAAWLRRAEVQAAELRCAPFDHSGFKRALADARALTREGDSEVFVPKLQAACAAHGVAVVFVPAPPGCPISGATKFLSPDKALLALSVRYKADDHLWFSFFHEGGHLVRHSKKLLFMEGIDGLDGNAEREADEFARDHLIPPAVVDRVRALTNEGEVQECARELGVSPGILVGRMQHEGWIPFSQFNTLKVRYHRAITTQAGDRCVREREGGGA